MKKDKKLFRLLGITVWMRSFTIFNIISQFPAAVTYTMVKRGNYDVIPQFLWLEWNWAHIAGWITSFANFIFYGYMISGSFSKTPYQDESQNYQPDWNFCWREANGFMYLESCSKATGSLDPIATLGVFLVFYEIITWCLFYASLRGAYRYGLFLMQTQTPDIF